MKKVNSKLYNFNKEMFERFQYAHLEDKPAKIISKEDQALEILKCKYNILYYLKNYCKIPLAGGSSTDLLMNDKLKTVALLYQSGTPFIFQTARQSSKTTIILCCTSWYMNFFENTKLLFYNMKIPDNKKNLAIVKQIISFMPKWMRTYDPSIHPNNVESFKNGLNSELFLKTVDRVDPGASGRGMTAGIFFDECAFMRNIHLAYSAIMFTYSNYSRIARKNYVPAPLAITSTPADPITPEGELFMRKWENAYEISYHEIENMIPHEVYEYCSSKSNGELCKVYQMWYEYPDRCEFNLYDENNPDNILHLLHDPFVDINELKKYSVTAATYLMEVRSYVTSKTKLRQEIYCEFLSSADQTIFDEDFIESIPRIEPIKKLNLPNTVSGTFNIYNEYDTKEIKNNNYALCVDPAYRVKGDYAGIVLFNLTNNEVEASAKLRLGKINNLVEVVKFLYSMYPTSVILIERNNFGIAVIERLLEDYKIRNSLFYSYGNKDPKRMSEEQRLNNKIYGIQTDSGSRPKMIQMLIKYVLENPEKIKSKELINELIYLQEKKNGRVEAMSGQHDDLVMALSFILYAMEYKEKDLRKFKHLKSDSIKMINSVALLNKEKHELDQVDKFLLNNKNIDIYKYDYDNELYGLDKFKEENNTDNTNFINFISKMN